MGLNEPILSRLPGGKIYWSLEQYIDHALLLSGSSYNVGVAKEERNNPPVSAKPESAHVMPATTESAHIVPATPKSTGPVHVMAAMTEPHRKMAATPESRLKWPPRPSPWPRWPPRLSLAKSRLSQRFSQWIFLGGAIVPKVLWMRSLGQD